MSWTHASVIEQLWHWDGVVGTASDLPPTLIHARLGQVAVPVQHRISYQRLSDASASGYTVVLVTSAQHVLTIRNWYMSSK